MGGSQWSGPGGALPQAGEDQTDPTSEASRPTRERLGKRVWVLKLFFFSQRISEVFFGRFEIDRKLQVDFSSESLVLNMVPVGGFAFFPHVLTGPKPQFDGMVCQFSHVDEIKLGKETWFQYVPVFYWCLRPLLGPK